MTKISKDKIISLNYVLYNDKNEIVDKTDKTPLKYLHGGYDDIFRKVEKALAGKTVGDEIDLYLSPEDAFGNVDPELIQIEPLEKIVADVGKENAVVGATFEATAAGSDEVTLYRVTDIAEGSVILDANSPLAGEKVRFTAKVVAIEDAGEEEIAAGTANLPGTDTHHH